MIAFYIHMVCVSVCVVCVLCVCCVCCVRVCMCVCARACVERQKHRKMQKIKMAIHAQRA
jgi:hypothetical protein